MSLTTPAISNFVLSCVVNPQILNPFTDTIPITLRYAFSNLENLKVFTGTFTPNNDYFYLLSGLTQPEAPNFIFVFCDGQLNIVSINSIIGPNYPLNIIPIQNCAFLSMVKNPPQYITGLYLEGRTSVPNPMPQGTPVNYTIITGTADVA